MFSRNHSNNQKQQNVQGGGSFSTGIPRVEIPILVTRAEDVDASKDERKQWGDYYKWTSRVIKDKLAVLERQLKLHRKANKVQKELIKTQLIADRSDLSVGEAQKKAELVSDAMVEVSDLRVEAARKEYEEKMNTLRSYYQGGTRQVKGKGGNQPRLPF